jgi:hypothetical protein
MSLEAFFLGLSNGVSCVAYCAPVLLPYLLGEGKGVFGNCLLTGQFLLGRLLGYLLFAVLAWAAGRMLLPEGPRHDLLIGCAYGLFAVLLIHYGFFKVNASCEAGCTKAYHRFLSFEKASLPAVAGLVTGLAFCPPFLLAFTGAAGQESLMGSLFFFISFFAGTSVLFLPAPFVGFSRRFGVLQLIGRMAAGLMGLYFLYSGIILIIGGYGKL